MLILEARHIKKFFGERLIIDLPVLNIYQGDKIGIVGLNGAGKTTLLKLLSGALQPDEGVIERRSGIRYIKQFDTDDTLNPLPRHLSGGEKMRRQIADALGETSEPHYGSGYASAHLLLADEPTSNLDIFAIEELQKKLCAYPGAILLISHDRGLLNRVCDKTLEIEGGKVTLFEGNYNKYRRQKDMELERARLDYEEAASERKRLSHTRQHARERLDGMRKTPKRMGNSEARLHKNGPSGQKNQERFIKNIDRRINDIESKINELPRRQDMKRVKIDIREGSRLVSKTALTVACPEIAAGDRVILNNVEFTIKTGSKTALIGANGTGKTTLVKALLNAGDNSGDIRFAGSAKVAYFAQDLSVLNPAESILSNVTADAQGLGGLSSRSGEARTVLARLGFRGDDVFKAVSSLSGGETVKACLAKIFSADVNMLILDEPTNYLDIYAAESLQELLVDYGGTVLLITHDRELIESVCDSLLIIENGGITAFNGGLAEYNTSKTANPDRLLMLENRLSYISGRLSMKSKNPNPDDTDALNAEFKALAAEIRDLKARVK